MWHFQDQITYPKRFNLKEKPRLAKVKEWIIRKNPEIAWKLDAARGGNCVFCKEFANIHRVNCDIWVCDEHWKKHGLEIHNKKIQ